MSRLQWSDVFATGIDVIDEQHKRIVHYINLLDNVAKQNDESLLREVLFELMDYTLSHFTFEEALMDEAGYPAATIHCQTHDSFRDKITDYQQRLARHDDIQKELSKMLNTWLIAHIADDDNSYVPYVINNMPGINKQQHDGWISRKLSEIFH